MQVEQLPTWRGSVIAATYDVLGCDVGWNRGIYTFHESNMGRSVLSFTYLRLGVDPSSLGNAKACFRLCSRGEPSLLQ